MLAGYIYSIILLKCLFYLIMIDGDDMMLWSFNTLRVFLQLPWLYYYLYIWYESLIYIVISTHRSAPRVVDKLVQWCFIDTSLYCTIIILYFYLLSDWPHSPCCMWCHWLPFAFSVFILFWLAFVLTLVFTLGWTRCGLPLVTQELYN